MTRQKIIGASVAVALGALCSFPATAQQRCSGPQLGTWKLQSWVIQEVKTGHKSEIFGAHPTGSISYGSDCRVQVILIKDARKAPAKLVPTDAERIDLYNGFEAYAGTYDIRGDIISHHIDASWNQTWTGTTQSRQFKIDGKSLHIQTMPAPSLSTGREVTSVLVWTKID